MGSFRLRQDRLLQRKGMDVPGEVSDREAGTNRSGNTGRTRLLYINREGVFLYPGFQRLKCCSCLHDNP